MSRLKPYFIEATQSESLTSECDAVVFVKDGGDKFSRYVITISKAVQTHASIQRARSLLLALGRVVPSCRDELMAFSSQIVACTCAQSDGAKTGPRCIVQSAAVWGFNGVSLVSGYSEH